MEELPVPTQNHPRQNSLPPRHHDHHRIASRDHLKPRRRRPHALGLTPVHTGNGISSDTVVSDHPPRRLDNRPARAMPPHVKPPAKTSPTDRRQASRPRGRLTFYSFYFPDLRTAHARLRSPSHMTLDDREATTA
ncbi:hypothetical protein SCOCK_450026 [Actinacidiphila cocklensis]|uniref:Uncharacterized protein n=1 Tax=Actinacidiphila cocklensis TaxID=887465 RepID=A0A9W4DVJ1_9ACTN|nr:hypothetical protein SCOCK_450026 [Actinacidiphila cocklensis]